VIDVGAISEENVGKRPPVLVLAVRLECDFFPEGEGRGGMLGVVAVCLALLRAVDAAEADTLRAGVVEDFDGVAVEDGDDLA
jgi:hypothetical protein